MPERLNRVTIALSREDVVLAWATRSKLLDELGHHESTRTIREAFEAVGATRPVKLTHDQKLVLLAFIEQWGHRLRGEGALHALPDGIFKLRNALNDDLSDARTHWPARV